MASRVKNIRTKNYQNLVIVFKLQLKMSWMLFGTQRIFRMYVRISDSPLFLGLR